MLSWPAWTFIILPKQHFTGGRLLSLKIIIEPSKNIDYLCHFCLHCNSFNCSLAQHFQNICAILCHRDNLSNFKSNSFWSGIPIKLYRIRSWPGVSALKSFGSEDLGVIGLPIIRKSPSQEIFSAFYICLPQASKICSIVCEDKWWPSSSTSETSQ